MRRALIIVDVQNDFLPPQGALAVPRGEEVVPVINRIQPRFDLVVATQDWHPPDHGSFAAAHPGKQVGEVIDLDGLPQVLWPVHCVQGTRGAQLCAALNQQRIFRCIRKGTDPRVDSYSAFFDNGRRHQTELDWLLRQQAIGEVFLAGLATDYCVKFTALDARQLGWPTWVVRDACRGIDRPPGEIQRAWEAMAQAGVRLIDSDRLPAAMA